MRVTECHPSYYYAPAPIAEALSDDAGLSLSDVWRLSVAYIGPKSRTERPRNTKIGTEVAHVTHDSDTTFNVKRSKIKVTGIEGILWWPPAYSLLTLPLRLTAVGCTVQ